MNDFCRCDNPLYTDGKCDVCQCPPREISAELLHKPPPAFSREPRVISPDPAPWRICPSCGVENTEHMPRCPIAHWNISRYAARLAVLLLSFAVAGQWVTTYSGERVCRLTQPIARGMTLQVGFCEDWQPGFTAPQQYQLIPFHQGWARNPFGRWLQIHVEDEGWVP